MWIKLLLRAEMSDSFRPNAPEHYMGLLFKSEKCMTTNALKRMYLNNYDSLNNSIILHLEIGEKLGLFERYQVRKVFNANLHKDASVLSAHLDEWDKKNNIKIAGKILSRK